MSVQEAVLQTLEQNRGRALSGQELAERLGVSRAAVWKAVESLRESGYQITAAPRRGYLLKEENDLLSETGIRMGLPEEYRHIPIQVEPRVDSTNTWAKRWALEGAPTGSLLVADTQTQGRGRYGKTFFSPAGTGLYLSAVLRPKLELSNALRLTFAAAVAVSRAVERFHRTPEIKWVNDIRLDGKKACGILTEAVSDFETGKVEAAIVGIGVNVRTEESSFPEELKGRATSLFPEGITRNELAASIAGELFYWSHHLEDPSLMAEYRKRLCVLGRRLRCRRGNESFEGLAVDLLEDGSLLLQTENGTVSLNGGEISLKGEDG